MASHKYRVSKEIILDIAEHCDLKTLSNLTQTCKDIHSLVKEYQHSIAKAKIAASNHMPPGLVLRSVDEQRSTVLVQRSTIMVRNSFATVQELDRRLQRYDFLLNRSAFLLTSQPHTLGMTTESVDKFKAGLQHAFCLADHLADLATIFTLVGGPPMPSLAPDNTNVTTTPALLSDHQQFCTTTAQIAHLRTLPSRALAWLLTLAEGASMGYARYSAPLLQYDPAMAYARIMAFQEVLLRHGGSLVVWGFLRNAGMLNQSVKRAVTQCAEVVMFFEDVDDDLEGEDEEGDGAAGGGGVTNMPAGLHMSIVQEVNRRITKSKEAEAKEKGEVWDEAEVDTREVWVEVNKLVAQEVGCQSWKGYAAIKHPT